MILVTGATGFLGHSICPHLVRRGYPVRALARSGSEHAFLQSLGIQLAWGDVRDLQTVIQAVDGCRAIIHAAGLFRMWGRREEFFASNVAGTHHLLEAAQRTGVERFIHISTIAVVGRPPTGGTITEETPCTPQDAYQESKRVAEQVVLRCHQEHGLPALILRPGAFYGPWGRYGFNRLFFEDPLKGLPLRVHRGRHITFPVYVADVAQAAERALWRGQPGQIYNICGPCLSHSEIGAVVEELTGRRIRWLHVPAWGVITAARLWTALSAMTGREPYYPAGLYPYVFRDWQVSSQKAQRELGFVPTDFTTGVRATLAWYREQGILG